MTLARSGPCTTRDAPDHSTRPASLRPVGPSALWVGWSSPRVGPSLERVNDPHAGRSTAVRAMTAKSVKLLDRGTQIPAKSFRLAGHTLTWTNAGQPRSAQLA